MSRDLVTTPVAQFVSDRDHGQCMAPRLGGTIHDCFDPLGYEHVKAEPRLAKRAPSCPCGLLVLCAGHREPGMRRGRVWATDKANREACRDYLRSFAYGAHVSGHAALIMAPANPADDCLHVDPHPRCDACQRRRVEGTQADNMHDMAAKGRHRSRRAVG